MVRVKSGLLALLILITTDAAVAGITDGGIGVEAGSGQQRLDVLDLEHKSDKLFSAGLIWFSFVNRSNNALHVVFRDANNGSEIGASLQGSSIQMLSPYVNFYPILFRRKREYLGLYAGARLTWDFPKLYQVKSDSFVDFTSLEMRSAWDDGYANPGILADLRTYVGAEIAVSDHVEFDVRYGYDFIQNLGGSQDHGEDRYSFQFVERKQSPTISVSMRVGWSGRSTYCGNCKGMWSLGYLRPSEERDRDRATGEIDRAKSKKDCGKLLRIAERESESESFRRSALDAIKATENDSCQRCLGRFAETSSLTWLAGVAVEGMTNQNALLGVAMRGRSDETRSRAAGMITDRAPLFALALASPDPENSLAAVERMGNDSDLYRIATNTGLQTRIRDRATTRITSSEMLGDLFVSEGSPVGQEAILGSIADPSVLARILPSGLSLELKRKAFKKLGGTGLGKVAQDGYADTAALIASRVVLGRIGWDSALARYSLGNVIGAIALAGGSKPSRELVAGACHKFVSEGNVSRIPELVELLNDNGDRALAEDYMNCGQPQLEEAARRWGKERGYGVEEGVGSHRVQWGKAP